MTIVLHSGCAVVKSHSTFLCLAVDTAVTDSAAGILRLDKSNNICDCEFSGMLAKNLFFYSVETKIQRSRKKKGGRGDANMINILLVLVWLC